MKGTPKSPNGDIWSDFQTDGDTAKNLRYLNIRGDTEMEQSVATSFSKPGVNLSYMFLSVISFVDWVLESLDPVLVRSLCGHLYTPSFMIFFCAHLLAYQLKSKMS